MGDLKLNERIIAFIVSWMLTPRGSNHSVLSEKDFALIYCIVRKIKVNWIPIFKEHMQKSIRLSDYHFPYVVLISKFLQYFEIDLEEELSEMVKPSHEVNNGSLSKMGFIKVGEKWVSKDEEQVGPLCGNQAETYKEDQVAPNTGLDDQGNEIPSEHAPGEAYGAGPSTENMNDYVASMSPFERLMINCLDNMAYEQRNHYDFCAARF